MEKDKFFDADVIVIGTGFASQSVLHQLRDSQLRILVLEGGDLERTKFADSLTYSDERGHYRNHHWGAEWPRVYGGVSRTWDGLSAPLEKWDLIGIDGRPKWPMNIDELEKWYRLAAPVMGEDPSITNLVKYDTSKLFVDRPFVKMDPPLSYSDPKLLTKYKNIELRVKHNVIRFTADESGLFINGIWYSVDGKVQFAGIKKNTRIVLGAGGLGNAQILLQPADNRQVPVGNESGLVGRTLMGHPHVPTGEGFVDPSVVKKPTWAQVQYKKWLPAYIVGADYKTKLNLLNTSIALTSTGAKELSANEATIQEFYEKKWGKKLELHTFFARSEQLPNPNNRIEIVPEKNAAGMFQMKIFCAFGSRDQMSIDKTARMLSDYLLKNKLGIATVDNDSIFFNTWGWAHPSGITRFGSSPKESVCDSNGRVWAYQNLFINGSSVFPTVGYANPAWTIVALGLRLGDHLLRESKKS